MTAALAHTLFFAIEGVSRLGDGLPFAVLMGDCLRFVAAEGAFLPMLGFRELVLIVMADRRSFFICPCVTAGAGVGGVSAIGTGGRGYFNGVVMGMTLFQLWNLLFLFESAFHTGKGHHTVRFFRCFLGDNTAAVVVPLHIQTDIAAVAADEPMVFLIPSDFGGVAGAMTAFFAVMRLPFRTFDTDTVVTAVIGGLFGTASLTQIAIGADFCAVFTFSALGTEACTVGAVFAAVTADCLGTVTAVMAVMAHRIGAVHADSAVGTVFVHASRAFSAVTAHTFRTVLADNAAFFADIGTVTALVAFFAEQIPCAFTAQVTGSAEFVAAGGADLTAVGAEIGTVFASFSAGTNRGAFPAQSAVHAEAVRTGAVHAFAALRTHLAIGAVGALFTAFHADRRTVGTSAPTGADHSDTGDAKGAFRAEVALSHAVYAEAAVHADFTVGALIAMLTAVGTDDGTLGASSPAIAHNIRTVFAKTAGVAEVSVTANAILTGSAIGAKLLGGTIAAFFIAFFADLGAL